LNEKTLEEFEEVRLPWYLVTVYAGNDPCDIAARVTSRGIYFTTVRRCFISTLASGRLSVKYVLAIDHNPCSFRFTSVSRQIYSPQSVNSPPDMTRFIEKNTVPSSNSSSIHLYDTIVSCPPLSNTPRKYLTASS
jgi:hypothetical protein